MKYNAKGFSLLVILVIILAVAVAGLSGFVVLKGKNTSSKSNVTTSKSNLGTGTNTSSPSNITISASDAALVKNLDKAPADAQQSLVALAKKNVAECPANMRRDTSVINANDVFVYLVTGCDSGYREILMNDGNGSWTSIFQGQSQPECDVVNKYVIPKSILYVSGEESSGQCYDASTQQMKTIPY